MIKYLVIGMILAMYDLIRHLIKVHKERKFVHQHYLKTQKLIAESEGKYYVEQAFDVRNWKEDYLPRIILLPARILLWPILLLMFITELIILISGEKIK